MDIFGVQNPSYRWVQPESRAELKARLGYVVDFQVHERERENLCSCALAEIKRLEAALQPIADAYPDDPGTADLYDEQPVSITLGDVRRVWKALAKVKP